MSSNAAATLAQVIIPNDEVLISRLSTSNFGDYILWLCSRCASEAHLALPGNGPQSSHSSPTEASAPQAPRCKLCQETPLASPIYLSLAFKVQSAPKLALLTRGCNDRHNEWTLRRLGVSKLCHFTAATQETVSADDLLPLQVWNQSFLCDPPLRLLPFSPPASFVLIYM